MLHVRVLVLLYWSARLSAAVQPAPCSSSGSCSRSAEQSPRGELPSTGARGARGGASAGRVVTSRPLLHAPTPAAFRAATQKT